MQNASKLKSDAMADICADKTQSTLSLLCLNQCLSECTSSLVNAGVKIDDNIDRCNENFGGNKDNDY